MLAGRAAAAAGALLAAVSVALAADDFTPAARQFAGGLSEPLLTALVLGAIAAELDRRRRLALALGFLAALLRPEAWPFLLAYGYWAAAGDRALRRPAAARRGRGAAALAGARPDRLGEAPHRAPRSPAAIATRRSPGGSTCSGAR